ncbi:Bax inhibitor-1/YccA family protein [Sphingomonas morindae]|uniref:Bax inhibitor-1/YccA family protein n=1 Tax=Sphingomonas morindae TaxID=1541170 RepID=A0ABY4X3L0_9SPHN|nr:Bax inhibitor-1/YccA family protein [Sphingomonas morindae]USI71483.1 Bax inhibitor-1/YccA family protein [Sphingomonas morindae]
MANWSDPRTTAVPRAATGAREAAFDTGLRTYMLSVYNYMTSGVLLTGIVALLFASGGINSPAAQVFLHGGPLRWVVMLAPLGVVMWLSFGINRLSENGAKALFWLYAVLMGLSLSSILLVYTGSSVAQAFFATAAGFGALSLYGYTTKRDLTAMGSFFIVGVVGLIVAMLINMFVRSTAMDLIISAVGVLLFAGLTAYDTQRIKSGYFAVRGTALQTKSAIMGALQLYLDFVNMFMFLLRFMGNQRN